jgi:hypothetical protein
MPGSAELVLGTNGVNPDKKASVSEVFSLNERGRYLQLRITNTNGRLTVRALSVEAKRADTREGTISHE